MGLVQRVISTVLYDNGANKQVSIYHTMLLANNICNIAVIPLFTTTDGMFVIQWNAGARKVFDCQF